MWKEAEDKVRHFKYANGVELHYHDKKGGSSHFHATKNGVNISGYHLKWSQNIWLSFLFP